MRTGALEAQMSMDQALARVEATDWTRKARRAVSYFASAGVTFTSDDLRDAIGGPPGSGCSVGAFFHQLADEGRIELVGSKRSTRPEAHGRRVMTWKGR